MIELQKPEDYTFKDFENTFALVDRLKADKSIRQRLVDSLEICFRESDAAIIETSERIAKAIAKLSKCSISANNLSANTTARFTKNPNRICSVSIRRSARVRPVRVSATRLTLISIWSFRIRMSVAQRRRG